MKPENNQHIPEGGFQPNDFDLVAREPGAKIHDEKFKSKPTTFFKDALRRFAKNKASVVGGVIIGVLMLSSFLSFLSPYDIKTAAGDIAKLVPKIREGGDGFWDGTEYRSNQSFDAENGVPYGVLAKDIIPGSLVISDPLYYDEDPNEYASGGYYRIVAEGLNKAGGGKYDNYYLTTYRKFNRLKANDHLTVTFTLGDTDGVAGYRIAPTTLYLEYEDDFGDLQYLPLAENCQGTEPFQVDVKEAMSASHITVAEKARLRFSFPAYEDVRSYILIEKVALTLDESASDAMKAQAEAMSFDNANWVAKNTSIELNPDQYWQSNGYRKIYHAVGYTCSYRFNQYEAVLGTRYDVAIGRSFIEEYIRNGWCEMSDFNDVTTFKLTNPESNECPVRGLRALMPVGSDGVYQYEGEVLYYRWLGFDKMPMYILGTDSKGHDMLTVCLSCLKNSLLLAVCTSLVCITIGLVWGSISGYFGGWVDLIMERITDILSGVPWIVVMTLVMLLLGRTVVTFGLAIVLTGWIGIASRTRTQFYRFKGREYVLASRTLGASDMRLIFRHILPNGLGTIVTSSVLMIPSTIFSEATLSYLGLGLQTTDSFGVVLAENQMFLSSRPALIIFPSIIISLLMISFNLFGNGLRDALNPTLKGGEQ